MLVCQTYIRTAVQNTSDFQVKSQVVTKTAEEPQTPTGTSDCCWDVHSCGYTLPIVLRYLLCSPGITAHWKLSLFDCWGLMEVACKKQPLYNVWSMQRMETRRYLWIWSPVTRIPHIWWRLCRRSWFVLPCYANGKVVLLCFVSAGPQTETSSRPNSCSRISHTSKHSVETAYTK